MEASPQRKQFKPPIQITQALLLSTIRKIYQGKSQAQVSAAQTCILSYMDSPDGLQKIVKILLTQHFAEDKEYSVKMAIATLFRKFSFDLGSKKVNKQTLVQATFQLILTSNLPVKVKDLLGKALQLQLEDDQTGLFNDVVLKKTIATLAGQDNIKYFQGLMIICSGQFRNITQAEDQIIFFTKTLEPVLQASLKMILLITQTSLEECLAKKSYIISKIEVLFIFFEQTIERIVDSSDQYQDQVDKIRANPFIHSFFEEFLVLFSDKQSIISYSFPEMNHHKITMINTLNVLLGSGRCPANLFNLLLNTFVNGSRNVIDIGDEEQILAICSIILTKHVNKKVYLDVFNKHYLDLIFASLMYSVSNAEEINLIKEQPDRFVQIADEYITNNNQSEYLKVRAAAFITAFATRNDVAAKDFVKIIVVIITTLLNPALIDPNTNKIIQTKFILYSFNSLNPEVILQTCFLVLSNLSDIIHKDSQTTNLPYNLFMNLYTQITAITSPIVLLRVIRAISHYPLKEYFGFVEAQMIKDRALLLQAIKCFQKIMKQSKFHQNIANMESIFISLMKVISISDPLMQIITNNHDKILIKSPQFYYQFRCKIRNELMLNLQFNQHNVEMSFNLLYNVIDKEKDIANLYEIADEFYSVSDKIQKESRWNSYPHFQDKIVDIYSLLVDKFTIIPIQIDNFVMKQLEIFGTLEPHSIYFKFYNKYIQKMDKYDRIQHILSLIMKEMKKKIMRFIETGKTSDEIAYYAFYISQIITKKIVPKLTEADLQVLLSFTNAITITQKQYLLIILLTNLSVFPREMILFLQTKNMQTGFFEELLKLEFQCEIFKKIRSVSLNLLCEQEENPKYLKKHIIICIKNLKNQLSTSPSKPAKPSTQNYFDQEEQNSLKRTIIKAETQRIQIEQNDNLPNIFDKFVHPYLLINEYQQFKHILIKKSIPFDQLTPDQVQDIHTIIGVQKIGSKNRVIRKIKKPLLMTE